MPTDLSRAVKLPDIQIFGARHHNLKNIDVSIPSGRITIVTGPSGSGKSTLAVNIIFSEGHYRYIQSLGRQAGRDAALWERPEVDAILNIPPPLLLEQKKPHGRGYHRSTVATLTGIKPLLRTLFSTAGTPHCPSCTVSLQALTIDQIVETLLCHPEGTKIILMAPATNLFGSMPPSEALAMLQGQGFLRVIINGKMLYTDQTTQLPDEIKQADIVIDRLVIKPGATARVTDSATLALKAGDGVMKAEIIPKGEKQGEIITLTERLTCIKCSRTYPIPEPGLFSVLDSAPDIGSKDKEIVELYSYLAAITTGGLNWNEVFSLTASGACRWIKELLPDQPPRGKTSAIHLVATKRLGESIQAMLQPLVEMGIGYLRLDTPASNLSTGEIQRLRLGEHLARSMSGVIYIMDEPTTGLHPVEHQALWKSIKRLRDAGNTILLVEHDTELMKKADWLLELGPGAGELGGNVLFSGTPSEIINSDKSVSGPWITERKGLSPGSNTPGSKGWLEFNGLKSKNLKDISVAVPTGCITCITGRSGSGKSALAETISGMLASLHDNTSTENIKGTVELNFSGAPPKPVLMDQSPVSGSVSSNPATWMGVFNDIRKLFAQTQEARKRGITAGWFSLTRKGGRCERCRGRGTITTDLKILPPVESKCDVCQGRRYNRDALSIKYKGLSMADVLDMSITEAAGLFSKISQILTPLEWLERAGLGYIKMGQHTSTLSGGEAQRLKLAKELARRNQKNLIYILDEPTMGLHPEDISLIQTIFNDLMQKGHTVVIVEHDMRLAAACDYIIELGPGSGPYGGEVIFQGTPAELVRHSSSVSGKFIGQYIS